MARKAGIWWYKEKKCYYTFYKGKRRRLDPNKKKAEQEWAKLMGKAIAKGDDLMVKQLLDQYLDWSEANHSENTHRRVRASILSFAESLPPGVIIGNLEPHHLTVGSTNVIPRRSPRRQSSTPPSGRPSGRPRKPSASVKWRWPVRKG